MTAKTTPTAERLIDTLMGFAEENYLIDTEGEWFEDQERTGGRAIEVTYRTRWSRGNPTEKAAYRFRIRVTQKEGQE